MVKHIHLTMTLLLLTAFAVYGCGSDGNSKAASILNDQADTTENYVDALSSAKNSDDVVAAIEAYTKDMKKMIPRIKEFQEEYPEYHQGKIPPGMEADVQRLEEISGKIPGAMMKIASYMMDEKVQSAMENMGKEMSKLQ